MIDTTIGEVERLRAIGYRVLAPFVGGARSYGEDSGAKVSRVLCLLDCETTDMRRDSQIIQLGIQRVTYNRITDVIESVDAPWSALEQPTQPISAEATRAHGLTIDDVKGTCFDEDEVQAQFADCRIIIAHNAAFDAPYAVRRFPFLRRLPWGCSMVDVDWSRYPSKRLGALLQDHTQHHFNGHDAGRDVAALAHVLATPFGDGRSPLAELLANARAPRSRVLALGAPYASKGALKARGYQWNDPTDEAARFGDKAWWADICADRLPEEREWLGEVVYGGSSRHREIALSPCSRFHDEGAV